MARKANGLNNAVTESFFATLKSDYFYLKKCISLREFRQPMKKYIHFSNHERIKMTLKGLSTVEYQTRTTRTD